MAVYTHVSHEQMAQFLRTQYHAELLSAKPISAGTENSNYHLSLNIDHTKSEYVLTLFESISEQQLNACLLFTQQLASAGFPVPGAIANHQGAYLHRLADKPCILSPFLQGQAPKIPSPAQCTAIADILAKIHLQTQPQHHEFENTRLLHWLQTHQALLASHLNRQQQQLLSEEMSYYNQYHKQLMLLPQGIIHNDLFRDNTLFKQTELVAILDFYSAGIGLHLYDLAIVINDWCFNEQNELLTDNAYALLQTYQIHKPFSSLETQLLPVIQRMAACRFWLSRIKLSTQRQITSNKQLIQDKNPEQLLQRLLFLRSTS